MAKKQTEGYMSAKESRRISKENRKITILAGGLFAMVGGEIACGSWQGSSPPGVNSRG